MPQSLQTLLADPFFLGCALLLAGGVVGYLVARLRSQQDITRLSVENAQLATEIHANEVHFQQQLAQLQNARTELANEFAQLSQRALKQNNGLFLRLAEQSMRMQNARSAADLEQRQQSIEHLLDPIRDTLHETQEKLGALEKERQQAFGSLQQQLHTLASSEQQLRQETRNLVNALRRPDARGRWGEITLRRLVELAGMVEHCDFSEQTSVGQQGSLLRPDMVVKLPEGRVLVIDAKTPLDAFLRAMDADSPEQEKAALQNHASQVKQRVRELAKKEYWQQFSESPDFIIMFLPGDSFLSAALQQDPALLDYAMQHKVVVTTPSSLLSLLRTVEFGWKQQQFSRNAEQIRQLGATLAQRLEQFLQHMERTGKQLNQVIDSWNRASTSLEHQVLPSARKMSELGIDAGKLSDTPNSIEKLAATPQSDMFTNVKTSYNPTDSGNAG